MSSQLNADNQNNPYAAPTARIDDLTVHAANELASRGTRLAAVILDGLAFAVPAGAMALLFRSTGAGARSPTLFLLFGLVVVVPAVLNLVFVFRYQQSIGKRMCGIKVVRRDGSRCNPWRIVLLRGALTGLLGQIPLIGPLFGLTDSLLIFREDHRCIHDHIAGTIVVRA